jgi:hypothetical protein
VKVSQSKLKLWRRCRAAYSYKYVDNLRKKVKSRPLVFGTIVHSMLEAHAGGEDPFEMLATIADKDKKLFEAEREAYGDIVRDLGFIMTDYFRYWADRDLAYIRVKGRNAEHSFEAEIAPGIILTGRIDAFARERGKKLKFIVEHKTFKRKPDDDTRWRNLQSAVYLRVAEMLGYGQFDGIIWDYIGSKSPTMPEILKNGSLSRRKITTLPSAMAHFLEEHNLSADHYAEFLSLVEEGRSDYFERVVTPVNARVVDKVFNDFLITALYIQELHGKDRTRTIDLHCSYCDYEPICRAELLDLDVDYIKKASYYVDEKEDAPTVETVD